MPSGGPSLGRLLHSDSKTVDVGMLQESEAHPVESESSLVQRVACGNASAVEGLLRLYGSPVFRFIYRRIGERFEDAEDLTQDTFLAAVSLADTFDGSCSILTWLCSLANIKVADHFRRQGRQKRVPRSKLAELDAEGAEALTAMWQGDESIENVVDRMNAQALLDGVLDHLSDDERESLLLHFVEGFTVKEMTQIMKRSHKGVESLLTRAKRRCRKVAGEWMVQ